MDKFEIFFISSLNLFLFYLINLFLIKKEILIDRKVDDEKHKSFINKNTVPLSGGLILFINCIFLNFYDNFYHIYYFLGFFLIGLLSDTGKLNSPFKRLLLQILIVVIFLFFENINIESVRISYLDQILEHKFFSIVFTTFCIVILVNGSNFIDGINFQSSGYYLALFTSLLLFGGELINQINQEIFFSIYIFLWIFAFFNIQNKSFLGDAGIYLLSFIVGIILIKLQRITNISPYFIVVLLWYPAFENLFSIIRKIFITKKKPDQADTLHLHHLLFKYLKLKFNYDDNKLSFLTSMIINLFNFSFFSIASNFIYSTKILLFLTLVICLIYSFAYNFLFKIKKYEK
tara:strand:+ start:615 stop:1652 length:1038 start_codon:yes stop_codon:yes gene_type:complete